MLIRIVVEQMQPGGAQILASTSIPCHYRQHFPPRLPDPTSNPFVRLALDRKMLRYTERVGDRGTCSRNMA